MYARVDLSKKRSRPNSDASQEEIAGQMETSAEKVRDMRPGRTRLTDIDQAVAGHCEKDHLDSYTR